MASGSESAAGTTLMDLITADPSTLSQSAPPATPSTLGKPPQPDRRPKKGTLMQIQSDTISVAKALNPVRTNIIPQKQKKKVFQLLYFLPLDLYLNSRSFKLLFLDLEAMIPCASSASVCFMASGYAVKT